MDDITPANLRELIQKYVGKTDWKIRRMIIPKQKNAKGEAKIYVEILQYTYHDVGVYRKKILRISTEIWVLPQYWSQKKQKVLDKDPLCDEKNVIITDKFTAIEDYLNKRKIPPFNFRNPAILAANIEKFRTEIGRAHV